MRVALINRATGIFFNAIRFNHKSTFFFRLAQYYPRVIHAVLVFFSEKRKTIYMYMQCNMQTIFTTVLIGICKPCNNVGSRPRKNSKRGSLGQKV